MAHEKITPIPGSHGDILLYLIKNVQKYFHLQLVLIISLQVVAASRLQILCFAFWFRDCLLRQPDKQRFLSNLNKTFPFLEQATHLLPLLGWHYFWQMQCNVSGVYLLHTNAHTITQVHTCTQTQTHIHTHTDMHTNTGIRTQTHADQIEITFIWIVASLHYPSQIGAWVRLALIIYQLIPKRK